MNTVILFLLTLIFVPLFAGLLGLGASYLQHTSQNTGREYVVDLDQDFFIPFYLALALVIVISIRVRLGTWRQSNVGESAHVDTKKKKQ
jgi:hypothetical protein